MSKYAIIVTPTAQKQLDKLNDYIAEPILQAISGLSDNPRPQGYKKLTGRPGYRIRKGSYRIIYDIFDKVLTVQIIIVGHRKDIYD